MLVDISDRERMEYERYVRSQEERIEKTLHEGGWDILKVSTDDEFVLPVIKFLKRRELLLR